jgi:hypothetical protein
MPPGTPWRCREYPGVTICYLINSKLLAFYKGEMPLFSPESSWAFGFHADCYLIDSEVLAWNKGKLPFFSPKIGRTLK